MLWLNSAIGLRQRVDVVQRVVVVDDVDRLADAHAEDARRVPAAALVELDAAVVGMSNEYAGSSPSLT